MSKSALGSQRPFPKLSAPRISQKQRYQELGVLWALAELLYKHSTWLFPLFLNQQVIPKKSINSCPHRKRLQGGSHD